MVNIRGIVTEDRSIRGVCVCKFFFFLRDSSGFSNLFIGLEMFLIFLKLSHSISGFGDKKGTGRLQFLFG
jgi:hypothetical protein